MEPDAPQPIVVPQEAGKVLEFLGVRHKLTRQENGGAYYLFDSVFEPESGNRLHVHTREDEVIYVLEGEVEIRLGKGNLKARTGGVAHLPKHIPHALHNPSKQMPLRILAIAIPGGMENYFDELSAAQEAGMLDAGLYREISLKYEIEWLE